MTNGNNLLHDCSAFNVRKNEWLEYMEKEEKKKRPKKHFFFIKSQTYGCILHSLSRHAESVS